MKNSHFVFLVIGCVICLIRCLPAATTSLDYPIINAKPYQSSLQGGHTQYHCHDNNGQLGCSFNLTETYALAQLQTTVYCIVANVEAWNCSRCTSLSYVKNFQIEKFIYDVHWDLKAMTGYFPTTDSIVAVFHGTNSRDIDNWLNDLLGWQVSFPLPYKNLSGVEVHAGFYRSYTNSIIHDSVRQSVKELVDKYGVNKNIKIIGHSLGAAFAEFAALDFLLNSTLNNIDLVTFGAPRVGNSDYYQLFEQLLQGQRSWRMTNKHDPVPFLPFQFFGYHHIAREAWIKSGNSIQQGFDIVLCDGSGEDPNCHDSLSFVTIHPDEHTSYFGLDLYQDYSQC